MEEALLDETLLADYRHYLAPAELAELYRHHYLIMIEEEGRLQTALAAADFSAILRTAHKIAGGAAAACFPALTGTSRALEEAARAADLALARELVARLQEVRDASWARMTEAGIPLPPR